VQSVVIAASLAHNQATMGPLNTIEAVATLIVLVTVARACPDWTALRHSMGRLRWAIGRRGGPEVPPREWTLNRCVLGTGMIVS